MKFLRQFNWILFFAMLALLALGTVAIWSAGNAREAVFHGMWKNNLFMALFALVLYFVLAFVDYRKTLGLFAVPAYVVSLALLVAVLVFGSTVFGGRRWLWFFQPSEVAKLCVVALVLFVLYYPALSGLPIPAWWADALNALPSFGFY